MDDFVELLRNVAAKRDALNDEKDADCKEKLATKTSKASAVAINAALTERWKAKLEVFDAEIYPAFSKSPPSKRGQKTASQPSRSSRSPPTTSPRQQTPASSPPATLLPPSKRRPTQSAPGRLRTTPRPTASEGRVRGKAPNTSVFPGKDRSAVLNDLRAKAPNMGLEIYTREEAGQHFASEFPAANQRQLASAGRDLNNSVRDNTCGPCETGFEHKNAFGLNTTSFYVGNTEALLNSGYKETQPRTPRAVDFNSLTPRSSQTPSGSASPPRASPSPSTTTRDLRSLRGPQK